MITEKINIGQIGEIKDFVKDFAIRLSHDLAENAEDDMIKAHRKIINDFYSSYDPTSYKRYNDLDDTLIQHKLYPLSNGTKHRARIKISPTGLGEHFNISANNVFDLIWNHGIRGLPKQGSKPLSHSVRWYDYFWYKGTTWINPYWNPFEYKNTFTTDIENEISGSFPPHMAMRYFIDEWGQNKGIKECEDIVNKII